MAEIELQERILAAVNEAEKELNSEEFVKKSDNAVDDVVKALQSLASDEYLLLQPVKAKSVVVTEEGMKVVEAKGSHEALLWKMLEKPLKKADVEHQFGKMFKVAFGQAMKRKWIVFDKKAGMVSRLVTEIKDETMDDLTATMEGLTLNPQRAKILIKRKLLGYETRTTFKVTKGPKFRLKRPKLETDITSEMLQSGAWETAEFKPYNFKAMGVPIHSGHLHPLQKVRAEFREIFLEMGFEEMPTNRYVESSFWNFDTLFQPQQHPARDMHDTFFLSKPAQCPKERIPEDYCERVKTVHEVGAHGSAGYRYDWKLSEALKNLLRTHTTAVSSRMLYKLAQQKEFHPVKYFSIDKVFRNEALDATHLAEFHQIEGFVADRGLSLGDLMGMLETFFAKLGMNDLRFKPTYNPYTEPSMEIFAYHKQLKKWVEVGNSGVFRPEMLLPMGIPEDVSVIAWGLSLERPTMIQYGISNIRDLVGHRVSLDLIRDGPICDLTLRPE